MCLSLSAAVKKLIRKGVELVIESGMGLGSGYTDEEYTGAGTTISKTQKRAEFQRRYAAAPAHAGARGNRSDEECCVLNHYLDLVNEHALVKTFKDAGPPPFR